MNWKAFKTSAGLSLLFFLVYGSSNWLSAQRHGVNSFYFAWEKKIPFVPLMIVPYLSIDLFFVAAPFLCRTDSQRRIFARRVTTAILVAGTFFLLMPLRFAFDRPIVSGPLGIIFRSFQGLDQPFNQLPSLHIALLLILFPVYSARCPGGVNCLVWIWFLLIGLSTVFTFQHHVIDLAGGIALAVVCFYAFPDQSPARTLTMRNPRVGLWYLAGALLLMVIGVLARPFGLLLLWPACSLAIAASGYLAFGPRIYRKNQGRLPLATRLMLWPVLLGQHVSLMHYRRLCRPWDRLTDQLWIGRQLSAFEAQRAVDQGFSAVLDLTSEFSESPPFRSICYRQIAIMDLTAPTLSQLNEAVDFIAAAGQTGVVYLHCKVGYSRTAAVAAVYLLASGQAKTAEQAVALLRKVRPSIVIRPEAMEAILDYEARCNTPATAPRQQPLSVLLKSSLQRVI